MYNIDNIIQSSTSTASSVPNTLLSTSLCQLHGDPQTSSTFHTSLFPSPPHNPPLASQHQHHHLHQYQSQSQILSQDEWELILSLRMIKNLSVSPSSQPSTSTICRQIHDTASNQHCLTDQTGHQTQLSIYPATTAQCIHSNTASTTTPQQFLQAQQTQCLTMKMQQLMTTATPSPSTISMRSGSGEISPSSQISISSQTSLSPQILLSSEIQSGHQNQSFELQLQLYSSPSASPRASIVSPVQQSQQISSDRSSEASPRRHQSVHPQTSTFYYDPMIVGSTVQLLDPTKPYEIGDTIKVGGRNLRSDISSLKYWLEDDITVTETASGGHLLNMAGYSYLIKNHGKNFITWECEHRRHRRCSSVVIRSSDPTVKNYFRIYSIQGEHNHEPASDNVEIRKGDYKVLTQEKDIFDFPAKIDFFHPQQNKKINWPFDRENFSLQTYICPFLGSKTTVQLIVAFKQRIKERCRLELSSPRTIYEDELRKGKFSSKMLAILPTFYNMQAQLYRIRQEHLPTSPTNPDFILHPAFATTDRGDRFLLYDSNAVQTQYASAPTEVGRLIIYASDLQLDILSKSERIGSDGTFETAAQISHQNYIIMGEFEEKHSVPLVFCLCERKNYETYELIIQVLKIAVGNLKLNFKPTYWMSDYESGLVKAIGVELPGTQLLGCAFHYNQAIYRNIQKKGLQEAYQDVDAVRQILRQIMALAFLPNDQIRIAYNDIIVPQLNNVPTRPRCLRQNLRNFFKYYESTWLTKIHQFCVFKQSTRTNNGLEGYNNKMSAQLSAHPHLYHLIVWFEKEELLVQQLVMKVTSNVPVHKRKRNAITILIDDSLQSLWHNYNAGTISLEELLFNSSKWISRKV